jgi:hypothetical protein
MIANRLPRGPAKCSAGWRRDHGGSDRSTRQSNARPDRCTDPQRPRPTPAAAQPTPTTCISALAPSTPGPRQNHNPHSAIHLAGSFNPASMRSADTRAAASALRPRTSQKPPDSGCIHRRDPIPSERHCPSGYPDLLPGARALAARPELRSAGGVICVTDALILQLPTSAKR